MSTTTGTAFESLEGHNFINLKTFRKSGEAVATPVWFAQDGNTLYVMTSASSGKAKRIRNNSAVEVAPCNGRGQLLGVEYQPAEARLLTEMEAKVADQMMTRKYGFQKRVAGWLGRVQGRVWAYLVITPASTTG